VSAADRELRFDVVWMTQQPQLSFGDEQLAGLNEVAAPGHYLVMPTAQRLETVQQNGNEICPYVNDFNGEQGYVAAGDHTAGVFFGRTAEQRAAEIVEWYEQHWWVAPGGAGKPVPRTGPPPQGSWIFLNELSRGAWTTYPDYPAWVTAIVAALGQAGFRPVLFSPFTDAVHHPNAEAWAGLAQQAFIAVESYLAGSAIAQQPPDTRVGWCATRYRAMLATYANVGVGADRIFLGEHFGQTLAGVARGRGGVSPEDWTSAINARSMAARQLKAEGLFAGYATYAWGYNQMNETLENLLAFQSAYTASRLPG